MKGKIQLSTKLAAGILAAVLVFGGVVGGTVAWLIDKTDTVVNTFTYGDINIELDESDTQLDDDDDETTNLYEMVPGQEITKDPLVTVLAGNEACWLFVELEKSDNFDTFMEYEIADGWTQLTVSGVPIDGVYYREVDEDTDDQGVSFEIIKDNTITVKDDVTKEMLNALDPEGAEPTYPTLKVTAYAVQQAGIDTPDNAWDYVLAEQNAGTTPNPGPNTPTP